MVDAGLQAVSLGGVNVRFQSDDPLISLKHDSAYLPFLNSFAPDYLFTIRFEEPKHIVLGDPVFENSNWAYYRSKGFFAIRMLTPGRPGKRDRYLLILPINECSGTLYVEDQPGAMKGTTSFVIPPQALAEVLAIHLITLQYGLMFHACGLSTENGHGLLFVGSSGAGKSTTADLWHQSGHATILGDECVSVFKRDALFSLQGTPWHGSGKDAILGEATVKAVFILFHSNTNAARLLTPGEAVSLLLPRAYLPIWDAERISGTLEFLEDLCSSVPCYHLGFTPDQRAVDYVQCLISS